MAILVDLQLFLSVPGLLLLLLASSVAFVSCVRLLWARRWKSAVGLTLMSLVVLLGVIWVAGMSREHDRMRYWAGLFATEVKPPPPLFDYDPPRTWLGDGFSLTVYELPDAIRQRFQDADQRLLTVHPQLPGMRRGWIVQTWTTGPLDKRSSTALDFAVGGPEARNREELARHVAVIRERITASRTFYAYFIEQYDTHITNVDLFIVDLEAQRLYILNMNT